VKTLREYSRPMDLNRFNDQCWRTSKKDISRIGEVLDDSKHYRLVKNRIKGGFSKVESRLMKLALDGANHKGVYKPKKE
jgi:hypothetical protein